MAKRLREILGIGPKKTPLIQASQKAVAGTGCRKKIQGCSQPPTFDLSPIKKILVDEMTPSLRVSRLGRASVILPTIGAIDPPFFGKKFCYRNRQGPEITYIPKEGAPPEDFSPREAQILPVFSTAGVRRANQDLADLASPIDSGYASSLSNADADNRNVYQTAFYSCRNSRSLRVTDKQLPDMFDIDLLIPQENRPDRPESGLVDPWLLAIEPAEQQLLHDLQMPILTRAERLWRLFEKVRRSRARRRD